LDAAIEQNRRRSRAMSRISGLSCGQRCPEDEMQDVQAIFARLLKRYPSPERICEVDFLFHRYAFILKIKYWQVRGQGETQNRANRFCA